MVLWMSVHLMDVLMIALVFRYAPLEALHAGAAGFTLLYRCLNAVFAMPWQWQGVLYILMGLHVWLSLSWFDWMLRSVQHAPARTEKVVEFVRLCTCTLTSFLGVQGVYWVCYACIGLYVAMTCQYSFTPSKGSPSPSWPFGSLSNSEPWAASPRAKTCLHQTPRHRCFLIFNYFFSPFPSFCSSRTPCKLKKKFQTCDGQQVGRSRPDPPGTSSNDRLCTSAAPAEG